MEHKGKFCDVLGPLVNCVKEQTICDGTVRVNKDGEACSITNISGRNRDTHSVPLENNKMANMKLKKK